jgi:hypothetical protein
VSGPEWLDRSLAALMVLVAAYSVGRIVAARRWARPTHVDVDLAHVLMGTAMAGMLASSLNPLPAGVWEIVFAGLGAWFVYRCVRFVRTKGLEGRDDDHVHHLSHYLTHLVMVGAMLYMYAVATPGVGASRDAGMAMNGSTGTATNSVALPLAFVAVLLASAVWELDGIGRFSRERLNAVGARSVALSRVADDAGSVGGASMPAALTERTPQPEPRPWLAPRLEAGCHIAMCVTMAYMLVLIF